MTMEARIILLAQAIGADIKTLTTAQGSLSALTTTAQGSLVAAINELVSTVNSLATGSGAVIDDDAGDGDTAVTWSADKIHDAIEAAKTAVTDSLTDGASSALDTLAELAAALNNDPSFAATIATEIANRVRYDAAQTLDTTQQAQARTNIGAASSDDLDALEAAIGDTDYDFVADYTTAKA
ncbi:MAG: hypothetical protein QM692_23745 [Thermomicrobiales bacterium]